jgi:hypothetical protein
MTIDNNHDYTQIRASLSIPLIASIRELADITFIFKLINGITYAPNLLNRIFFNISSYNRCSKIVRFM